MFDEQELEFKKNTLSSLEHFIDENQSRSNDDIASLLQHLSTLEYTISIPIAVGDDKTLLFIDTLIPHGYPGALPSLQFRSKGLTKGSAKRMSSDLLNYLKTLLGETCMAASVLWLQDKASSYYEFKSDGMSYLSFSAESNTKECSICLDEPDELVTISECKHKFCKECLSNYIGFKTDDVNSLFHHVTAVMQQLEDDEDSYMCSKKRNKILRIDDYDTYGVTCPGRKCKHVMLPSELSAFASPSALEHFDRFSRIHRANLNEIERQKEQEQELLRAKENAARCPRCFSRKLMKFKFQRLRCAECFTPMCSECYQTHARAFSCTMWKAEMFDAQTKGYVRCPWCLAPTEKIDGCNFMTCSCGGYFCNLCGIKLDQTLHFTHYGPAGPFGASCLGRSNKKKSRVVFS